MNTPIIVERVFSVSQERLWRALTDKNEMKQWYFDLPEFIPIVGFEFTFMGGKDADHQFKHLCRITEIMPNRKIAYTWRYDGYEGNSLVAFELFSESKESTRLRITHEGLHTFPPIADLARTNFEEGWNSIINGSLRKFLEVALKPQ